MKRVTPFTAVRGLIATAVALLLAGLILLASPAILLIMACILATCVLRSDSWGDSWEMFSGGLDDMFGDVASFFRGLSELWVTEVDQ